MTDLTMLRTVLDLVPDVVYFQDARGRYRYANEAAASNLGLTVEELIGRTEEEVFEDPETAEMIRANREEILEAGEARSDEGPVELPGSGRGIYESRSIPIDEDVFGIAGVAGVVRDVTERVEAERELSRTKEKLKAVFELTPVSLIVVDAADDRVLTVNRAFEELCERGREEVEGRPPSDIGVFLDPDRIEQLGTRAVAEGEAQEDVVRIRRASGEVRDVLLSCVSLDSDGDAIIVAAGQDVSPFVRRERELRRRAFHDALTGLPNRELLWDRCIHALKRARRTGEQLGLLYLDLDGFKSVNDAHGHAAGDSVLTEISERLSGLTRGEDTVARIGGDEFVILLESAESEEDIETVAGRVLAALSDPLAAPGGTLRLSASCGALRIDASGAASEPEGGDITDDSVEALLAAADRAMYAAKREGGSSYRTATYP